MSKLPKKLQRKTKAKLKAQTVSQGRIIGAEMSDWVKANSGAEDFACFQRVCWDRGEPGDHERLTAIMKRIPPEMLIKLIRVLGAIDNA